MGEGNHRQVVIESQSLQMKHSSPSIALVTNLIFPQDVLSDVARFSDVNDHHVATVMPFMLYVIKMCRRLCVTDPGPENPCKPCDASK